MDPEKAYGGANREIRQNLSARDFARSIRKAVGSRGIYRAGAAEHGIWSSVEIQAGCELAHAQHLLLRAPEQGEIDPTRETDHGEVQWLVARGDRLDDSW